VKTVIGQTASSPAGVFVPPALRRPKARRGGRGRAFEARFDRIHENVYSIGLFVATSGALGIWGPSAIACARLAAEEINRAGGLLGQEVRLSVFDSADERPDLADEAQRIIAEGEIDAIVGMHTSAVRQRLLEPAGGNVPYVYTPLYEGGERAASVYTIGETPKQQLRPAIHALGARFGLRRWALLGNDYIWPRVSHALAHAYVRETGGEVVDDLYLPLGTTSFEAVLARLSHLRADALLLSLAGQDAIEFNRNFGAAGAAVRGMVRLSCAIEENGLLAMGAENTDHLYAAAGYFSGMQSNANMAFKERYYALHGERAPTLNALGQSTYEGVHFLAALIERQHQSRRRGAPLRGPLHYRSAREAAYVNNDHKLHPMYLARAEGHLFQVIERL
jgi:ABC-type branched-subunit amino acid transport system substrate-binding protein